MSTRFKELRPYEAWEEAEMRSVAIGVAGFFVGVALQTAGDTPIVYWQELVPVSGMVSAFLTALTLSVAYYHKRWMLGIGGAALFLILPLVISMLWIKISGRSLCIRIFRANQPQSSDTSESDQRFLSTT